MTNFEKLDQPPINETILPRFAYPEKLDLTKGEEFLVDTAFAPFDPADFGLPKVAPSGDKIAIVGIVGIKNESFDFTEKPEATIALTRVTNKLNVDHYFMVADSIDENGSTTSSWTQLSLGTKFIIGRKPVEQRGSYTISGEQIIGKPFSQGVSRNHMQIERTEEGIRVSDLSANGTRVEGVKK
jgi:hypothetical protein